MLHSKRVLALVAVLSGCGDSGSQPPPAPDGAVAADARAESRVADGRPEAAQAQPDGAPGKHKAEIDKEIAPLFDDPFPWVKGVVVGVLTEDGPEVYGYGVAADGKGPPDANTLFPIGSITKVFTTLLLALMANEGTVTLDQPVQELLPAAKVTMPQFNGVQITLRHLATHTSGLPREADNEQKYALDWFDTWKDYGVEQAYEFLNSFELSEEPGTSWEYSNPGGALLGHVLSRRDQRSWEEMVQARITEPLNLSDTTARPSAAQQARLAQGYDWDLNKHGYWNPDTFFEPAGYLFSTAHDLLAFISAQAGLTATPLTSVMKTTQETQFVVSEDPPFYQGLSWLIDQKRLADFNGATYSGNAYVGFDMVTKRGVVVLTNTSCTGFVPEYQIGTRILQTLAGMTPMDLDLPKTIAVDPSQLAAYTGTYTGDLGTFTITSDGKLLTMKEDYKTVPDWWAPATPDQLLNLYPTDVDHFTDRGVGNLVDFEKGADGTYDTLNYTNAYDGTLYKHTRVQ